MAKNKYYVVLKGKITGIFPSVEEAREQTAGIKNSKFVGCKTKEEAEKLAATIVTTNQTFYVVVKNNKAILSSSGKEVAELTHKQKGSKIHMFSTIEEAKNYCLKINQLKIVPSVPEEIEEIKRTEPVTPLSFYVDGAYFPSMARGFYGIVCGAIRDYGELPTSYAVLQSYGAELYACKRAIDLAYAYGNAQVIIYSDNSSVINFIKNRCVKPEPKQIEQQMKQFYDVMTKVLDITIEHIDYSQEPAQHKLAHRLCQNGRIFMNS